jgi:uncharacterized protein YbbC (DUF1343 family)
MFDNVMGTDAVRIALKQRIPAAVIIAGWKKEVDAFVLMRKKYLLYE